MFAWPNLTFRVVAALVACTTLALSVSGCDDNPSAPSGVECWFSGITETDEEGNILSEDPDDWCYGGGHDSYTLFAYPNPASEIIMIAYYIPASGPVRIRIMVPGCIPVRTLLDTEVDAGTAGFAVWNFIDESGARVRPGIYRCWLEAGGLQCYGDILVLALRPGLDPGGRQGAYNTESQPALAN